MADADYTSKYMDDGEEEQDYNNLYDNIPTPVEGEEPFDEFAIEKTDDDDDDEVPESESEEEEDPNAIKVDPYDSWDALMEIKIQFDLQKLLIDDALQEMWAVQEAEQEELKAQLGEEEEDEEDDTEEEDEEEIDEELAAMISSDGASDDEEPPADDIGSDSDIYKLSGDENQEEDAFSLNDIDSEPEALEETETIDGTPDGTPDELENNGQIETDDGKVKEKRYRKISKHEESDTTEYETITSASENEIENENELLAEQEENLEEMKEKNPSPDPYAWIEYEKELDEIEEYDDDFVDKFLAKNTQLSEASSTDEDDDENDSYDLPMFSLPPSEILIAKNKNRKDDKVKEKTRISGQNFIHEKRKRMRQDLGNEQVDKTKRLAGMVYNRPPPDKYAYNIDIGVYRFDNYPEYDSPDEESWIEKELEENQKNEAKNDENNEPKKKESRVKKVVGNSRDYFYLKRKQRTASYKRVNDWYHDTTDEDTNRPDDELPSYKAKMRSIIYQEKTIEVIINSLVEQTLTAIDRVEKARKRKEGTHYSRRILSELCDAIVMDIEEKQQTDAVQYCIEVLIDQWEQHVHQTRMNLIEEQMDSISETIVTSAITNTINNIVEEDIYSTLIVRDTLAESLKEIGMRRARINVKLGNMFQDYQFDSYDFDKGSATTKIKRRIYRSRKELDGYLEERLSKINLGEEEQARALQRENDKEIKEQNKKVKKQEESEESKKGVLEKKQSFYPAEKEESAEEEEEDITKSPLDLTPENSETEELREQRDTHELIDSVAMQNIAFTAHRRSTIVALWTDKQRELMENLRKKGLEEYEGKPELESEDEEIKEVDLNQLYELSDESENEDEFVDETKLGLPDLKTEVEYSFMRGTTPTEIHVTNVNSSERIDSAVLAEIDARKPKQRASMRLAHRDSGINSIATAEADEEELLNNGTGDEADGTEDEEDGEHSCFEEKEDDDEDFPDEDSSGEDSSNEKLVQLKYEKRITNEEIIKMIPKLDTDYYLQTWLHDGAPKIFPSPPISPNDKKVRRYHLKRPHTAASEETIHDVVPIEFEIYASMKNTGRLNSALSHERPETSSSFYTGRESAFSNREDDFEEDEEHENEEKGDENQNEDLSSEEDKEKKLKWIPRKKTVKKRTKIEFTKTKESNQKEQGDKKDDSQAWNFYRKQRKMKKEERERTNDGNRSDEYVIQIPPKKLFEHEKEEIISKSMVKLDERFEEEFEEEEDELDDEVLRIQMNDDEDIEDETEEKESERNAESVIPPSTPWQRDRERPMTPDSQDSEEEFEKLRKSYINNHTAQRTVEKNKHMPERKWKEYLKKKSDIKDNAPGMPKSGWKAHPSIIPWKNANEEVRKCRNGTNNDQEAKVNHNRELFQRLQIMADREQKHDRLLIRRATMHGENATDKREKRKKLGLESSTENSRPVTTRSSNHPSYMKTTKATVSRNQPTKSEDRLPAINNKKISRAGNSAPKRKKMVR